MKAKRLKEERIIMVTAALIFAVAVFTGTLASLENKNIHSINNLDEVIIEDKETDQSLEGWMSDLVVWGNTTPQLLEPILPENVVSEEDFGIIKGRVVNIAAIESSEEIPLEDWMMNQHKFRKVQGM